jgi:SAM-dependent methyltransferase
MRSYEDANRLNWDDRADIHSTDQSGTYPIDAVLAGGSSLNPIETREIGDVSGRDILHLQCHIGLDSISLKNFGARSVTGVDISARSIAYAVDFARQADADVHFVEGSVYDAPHLLDRTFDLVYATWGTINWLGDIERWAHVVAKLLRPGGMLYLLDGHPQLLQTELRDGSYVIARDWRTASGAPMEYRVERTYTGDPRVLSNTTTFQWIHPLGSLVNAIVSAGLNLRFLNEHETISWKALPSMITTCDGQFALPAGGAHFPLAFSIGAVKPG